MATFARTYGLSLPLLLTLAAFRWPTHRRSPTTPAFESATDNGPPAPLPGLGQDELDYFDDGLARFQIVEVVSGADATQGNGLGRVSIPTPASPATRSPTWVAAVPGRTR